MVKTTGDEADVAIIGMAGRFPGADNVGEFWQNLCEGVAEVFTDPGSASRFLHVNSASSSKSSFSCVQPVSTSEKAEMPIAPGPNGPVGSAGTSRWLT